MFCDRNLLEQKIDSLNCMKDNIAPVDARIEDNGESFEIVPETVGTQVNRERLDETILRGCDERRSCSESGRGWLL